MWLNIPPDFHTLLSRTEGPILGKTSSHMPVQYFRLKMSTCLSLRSNKIRVLKYVFLLSESLFIQQLQQKPQRTSLADLTSLTFHISGLMMGTPQRLPSLRMGNGRNLVTQNGFFDWRWLFGAFFKANYEFENPNINL